MILQSRLLRVSLAGLVSSAVLCVIAFTADAQGGRLFLHFLDVGQGDGIVLRTPYHQTIIFDGGPDRALERKLGGLLPYFDRTIDLLVVTHPHEDHVAGFDYLFDRYDIRSVLITDILHESGAYKEFLRQLEKRNIPHHFTRAGDRISLGPDVRITILAPTHSFSGSTEDDLNNSSVVAMLEHSTKTFLLTGDAGTQVEEELIQNGLTRHVDVLKTGHHGSRTSTGDALLDAITPTVAIISAGESNMYGHPHSETLERLKERGIRTLRTDTDGDITLVSTGAGVTVDTEHNTQFSF